MIFEYALDPLVCTNWPNFRFYYNQFGIEHGRLISAFPEFWVNEVRKGLGNRKPVERKSIVERLRKIDSKMLPTDRDYDSARAWIENAVESHSTRPFRAIITMERNCGHECTVNGNLVDVEHPVWRPETERRVKRTASELAKAASVLPECSTEIVLVDQNFRFNRAYGSALSEFIKCGRAGKPLSRFEYHVSVERTGTAEHFEGELNEKKRHWAIDENFHLVFVRWNRRHDGENLHARFVLTERGGLRYDYGLDEGSDDETNLVSLLSKATHESEWPQYQPNADVFDFVDAWIVTHDSVTRAEPDGNGYRALD